MEALTVTNSQAKKQKSQTLEVPSREQHKSRAKEKQKKVLSFSSFEIQRSLSETARATQSTREQAKRRGVKRSDFFFFFFFF